MDPVTQTLRDLENPKLYEREDNVPIFGPHKRKKQVQLPNGQTIEREIEVKPRDLEAICNKANARAQKGNLVKGTLGHFLYGKDVPEEQQPPIACFYQNFRVGHFGPERTLTILATRYIRKDCDPKTGQTFAQLVRKEYPERSADYYDRTKEITAVASLKRDAELDLGTISYARGYAVRYLEDEKPEMNPDDKPQMQHDPAGEPDANAPDPGFMDQYERCTKMKYPHLEKMHTSYAATLPPTKPEMGTDGDQPGKEPGAVGAPPPKPEPNPMEKPMQNARDAELAQFQKLAATVTALEASNKELQEQAKSAYRDSLEAKRRADLTQYASTKILDVETELKDVMDCDGRGTPMNGVQYSKHLDRIKRYADREQDITQLGHVQTATNRIDPDAEPTARECTEAIAYMRERTIEGIDCPFEDAVKYVRKRK